MTCTQNGYNMTTKDMIAAIAEKIGLTKRDTERLMSATLDEVTMQVLAGQVVALQNVGTLEIKKRAERITVHPKTGERIITPEKLTLSFKPTDRLKDALKKG